MFHKERQNASTLKTGSQTTIGTVPREQDVWGGGLVKDLSFLRQ